MLTTVTTAKPIALVGADRPFDIISPHGREGVSLKA